MNGKNTSDSRDALGRRMHEHYESVWQREDPWGFERSPFDHLRYRRQHELLQGKRYQQALEIGCGSGHFTRLLSELCDHVVALDIAESAIQRARQTLQGLPNVDLRVANVMEWNPRTEGPWDLVVMSETIYCLGWLYPMFDVGWLCSEIYEASRPGARMLLVNTYGTERDHLLLPWLIDTYRDLLLNIGYECESEEILQGSKDGVDMQVLMSLLQKP